MTFLTNGSWATREKMVEPGLILYAISPSLFDLGDQGIGTVQLEYRFRVSERNAPGAESIPPVLPGVLPPIADPAESKEEPQSNPDQAENARVIAEL